MKKNFTIDIAWKKLFLVVLPITIALCGAAALIGIAVVDRVIMPSIVGIDKGIVSVPSVIDMTADQARDHLLGAGLLCLIREREFNETVAEGRVIRQDPAVGESVKKGRRIDVFVSRGTAVATVPNVNGMSERQARITLRQEGFVVGKMRKVYSDEEPVDAVVQVSPPPGARASREVEVELAVSNGPRPTHAQMPNLVGEPLGQARQAIEEIGLVLGKVDYAHSSSLVPGTIISQSVSPGSRVPLESSVGIVVSIVRE